MSINSNYKTLDTSSSQVEGNGADGASKTQNAEVNQGDKIVPASKENSGGSALIQSARQQVPDIPVPEKSLEELQEMLEMVEALWVELGDTFPGAGGEKGKKRLDKIRELKERAAAAQNKDASQPVSDEKKQPINYEDVKGEMGKAESGGGGPKPIPKPVSFLVPSATVGMVLSMIRIAQTGLEAMSQEQEFRVEKMLESWEHAVAAADYTERAGEYQAQSMLMEAMSSLVSATVSFAMSFQMFKEQGATDKKNQLEALELQNGDMEISPSHVDQLRKDKEYMYEKDGKQVSVINENGKIDIPAGTDIKKLKASIDPSKSNNPKDEAIVKLLENAPLDAFSRPGLNHISIRREALEKQIQDSSTSLENLGADDLVIGERRENLNALKKERESIETGSYREQIKKTSDRLYDMGMTGTAGAESRRHSNIQQQAYNSMMQIQMRMEVIKQTSEMTKNITNSQYKIQETKAQAMGQLEQELSRLLNEQVRSSADTAKAFSQIIEQVLREAADAFRTQTRLFSQG